MIQLQTQTFGCLQCALGVYTLILNRDAGLNLSTHKCYVKRRWISETSLWGWQILVWVSRIASWTPSTVLGFLTLLPDRHLCCRCFHRSVSIWSRQPPGCIRALTPCVLSQEQMGKVLMVHLLQTRPWRPKWQLDKMTVFSSRLTAVLQKSWRRRARIVQWWSCCVARKEHHYSL